MSVPKHEMSVVWGFRWKRGGDDLEGKKIEKKSFMVFFLDGLCLAFRDNHVSSSPLAKNRYLFPIRFSD